MTSRRRDSHSTEFGLWLRDQKEIDSKLGYIATNIDYIWTNYKTGEWMIIEEKRRGKDCSEWQRKIFRTIHKSAKHDPKYRGIYLVQFENTSPDDGKIWINKKPATKADLIKLLQFKLYQP
jgi:hypothetical protein